MNLLKENFLYLFIMIVSLSYPFISSFESRINFVKKWKFLFISIFLMMLVFIPWDIYFTYKSVWSFNDSYILGWKLFLLPIEEWLFFIIIPFCCVFIHEVLAYFFSNSIQINRKLYYYISCLILVIGLYFNSKLYTFCVLSLTSFLLFFSSLHGSIFINNLIRTYLVSLVPFIVVNGILTGSYNPPIVMYNPDEIINIRFLNIPIEDFFYSFSMLALTMLPYNYLDTKFNNNRY